MNPLSRNSGSAHANFTTRITGSIFGIIMKSVTPLNTQAWTFKEYFVAYVISANFEGRGWGGTYRICAKTPTSMSVGVSSVATGQNVSLVGLCLCVCGQ